MDKNVPVTIIWDSVAATSPKAELVGDYDKETIGLQARVISKGMRKINGVIANENVLFVCLNQIRTKIGVMYGDPTTTPGGKAIPFHSSVRIKLGAGQQIKDKKGNIVGINVSAKTIKNKVAPPFRTCNFEIHFGKGIVEHEQSFDVLRRFCKENGPIDLNGKLVSVDGTSAWKTLNVKSRNGRSIIEKKFYKTDFGEVSQDPEYAEYITAVLNAAYSDVMGNAQSASLDTESYEEVRQIALDIEDDEFVNPE